MKEWVNCAVNIQNERECIEVLTILKKLGYKWAGRKDLFEIENGTKIEDIKSIHFYDNLHVKKAEKFAGDIAHTRDKKIISVEDILNLSEYRNIIKYLKDEI